MDEILDSHTFIGEWAGLGVQSTAEGLLKSMEKAGIVRAVIIATNKDGNENVKRIAESNRARFYFAFWFVPDRKHFAYLKEHHNQIKVVKFHPSHAKTRLDDPKMLPLLKFCGDEHIPILVHCGRWREMAGYDIALKVAEEHEATILLAHMGGVIPDLVKETAFTLRDKQIKNAYLMTSGISRSPAVYWLEPCPPQLIDYVVDVVGADKVIFGSDYPFGKQEDMVKSINKANLSAHERAKIFYCNARSTLNLE